MMGTPNFMYAAAVERQGGGGGTGMVGSSYVLSSKNFPLVAPSTGAKYP